jgi:hypothetical protein
MTYANSVVGRVRIDDILRLACAQKNSRGFFLCPIHSDTHPSGHVDSSGTWWRCFACGAKGGILDLAIALGLANDRASAAAYLERRVA